MKLQAMFPSRTGQRIAIFAFMLLAPFVTPLTSASPLAGATSPSARTTSAVSPAAVPCSRSYWVEYYCGTVTAGGASQQAYTWGAPWRASKNAIAVASSRKLVLFESPTGQPPFANIAGTGVYLELNFPAAYHVEVECGLIIGQAPVQGRCDWYSPSQLAAKGGADHA